MTGAQTLRALIAAPIVAAPMAACTPQPEERGRPSRRATRARLSLAGIVVSMIAGCGAAPAQDPWLQIPEPASFRETAIDSLADLVERSDLVIEGTITRVDVRDRGVWSEAQGPDDVPIRAEDVVLTIHAGEPRDGDEVEVRIEHLYDEQPGAGPLDPSSLEFDSGTYVFILINDENALVVKSDGPGYRCTDEADFCGFTFDNGALQTTPRQSGRSVPLSTLLPDAGAITSFADLTALAEQYDVTALG